MMRFLTILEIRAVIAGIIVLGATAMCFTLIFHGAPSDDTSKFILTAYMTGGFVAVAMYLFGDKKGPDAVPPTEPPKV